MRKLAARQPHARCSSAAGAPRTGTPALALERMRARAAGGRPHQIPDTIGVWALTLAEVREKKPAGGARRDGRGDPTAHGRGDYSPESGRRADGRARPPRPSLGMEDHRDEIHAMTALTIDHPASRAGARRNADPGHAVRNAGVPVVAVARSPTRPRRSRWRSKRRSPRRRPASATADSAMSPRWPRSCSPTSFTSSEPANTVPSPRQFHGRPAGHLLVAARRPRVGPDRRGFALRGKQSARRPLSPAHP
jgi:hypothetical protein